MTGADLVLLPGTWMTARVWARVARGLHALGHRVHQVELPGLGDPDAPVSGIGLATHVDHVTSVIESRNLRNAIMVAHSYSGIVTGMLADRVLDRVAHTVYVEAFLAHDGRSMLDAFSGRQRAEELRLIARSGGRWPPPDAALLEDGQDLSMRQATWLAKHLVGHPGRTIREPATLRRPIAHQRSTYVVCAMDHFDGVLADDVTAMAAEATWSFRTLRTGRWPMVSAPGELVALLAEIARAPRAAQPPVRSSPPPWHEARPGSG
jgi:pimeloyl-ACP methyl ester carboxylesterase